LPPFDVAQGAPSWAEGRPFGKLRTAPSSFEGRLA
jgi:hypothetical protein